MGFNERYFNSAMSKLEQRRSADRVLTDMRRQEIYSKLPEYHRLADSLAQTGQRLVSLIMKGDSVADEVSRLEKENLETQRSMTKLLAQAGYPEDYLEPQYTCQICRDKGTANGRWCSCFQKLMLDAAAKELNENSPLELSSFDSFRLDYYPDQINPEMRVSERTIMQRNFEYCKSYAAAFTPKSEGILMSGATGLGKTHLSLAIASQVLKKGHSVIYGSVPELLRMIEREYFGKSDNDTMSAIIGCDLLILDDLGAEMDKQLYSSLLYEVINSRISRGLPMIVSTNYTTAELKNRYQDKICSRLLSFRLMVFFGSDIRRILKKSNGSR